MPRSQKPSTRRPATRFPHLRKKMQKAKVRKQAGKKKEARVSSRFRTRRRYTVARMVWEGEMVRAMLCARRWSRSRRAAAPGRPPGRAWPR